ncbi:MAG: caspase family protein [Bacteroidetes bacterium]|nr:MAG: caspase family protein [Bacteroidota bacterium]
MMKKSVFSILFTCLVTTIFSQVSETKSGVIQLNISKKGTEFKKISEENKSPSDVTPPVITLQTPALTSDSVTKSTSKTLIVKGKVQDTGGIFEVLVNEVEAKVSSDGVFLAEIPQAFGKNRVKIKATDVSLNSSVVEFYSERLTSEITGQTLTAAVPIQVPVNPVNTYSIEITSPSTDNFTLASDKFTLQACVKATAPIKKIMISRNGTFVNGFLSNNIIQDSECSFRIDEPLSIKLGMNDIKIEVFAIDDTISKSITVEYSLYAARNYALLIGNEKYDDPEISELEEPLKDATEMYNTLTKEYNFDPENVILLKNATQADIIGTLHRLRSKITPTDNLLIFYAGHGYWDEGMGVGYWLPKDAARNNPVNWIPNTDLTNYLGAIKSKHTLLIADACFSGGIFKTRSAFSATYAVEMLYQLKSRKAITSGTLTLVPDRSVFFQYLIKNLKDNTNEYLSAEELFSKMRMAVINNSENVPQFGTIQNVGDEGGDFIFIKRKTAN